ncbi:LacI family DNA-binding transcriptional regulator [Bifidobacterium sp.]|jgi:LacI family transcriptional regulator|uniref:LacI family DNA-binding transcriptional regulator n=1 Tax=Bifidobacterium sp. TaxID=41200 RepID=UPI0025C3786F|nr:LacI family DNA-binding transcriptional regulator [Bifidobacterium sp.]MCH4209435.1 LacI family transcriptional regulator [Bifidobacterium sp.]MCI1224879.1 LacI family transcriptional regulator [Bifidobacterium sp.]
MATLTTITIRDIAAACHASTASVSRALNGKPGVSDGLKATIIAYASAHGYVPDSNARSMRLGQSTHIYLINRVENTDSSGIPVEWFAKFHAVSGLNVDTYPIPYSRDLVDGLIELERARHPAMFLLVGPCGVEDESRFSQIQTPMMFVLSDDAPAQRPSVESDDTEGAMAITNSLLEAGHRNIMVLTDRRSDGQPYYQQRIEGFKRALAGAGIPFDPASVYALPIDFGRYLESSTTAINRHLIPLLTSSSMPSRPTAFVILNDFLAFTCTKALSDAGIRIPDQLSVVSFGGWSITGYLPASIQTWVQPVQGIIQAVATAVRLTLSGKPFSGTLELGTPEPGKPACSAVAISPTQLVVHGYLRKGQSIRQLTAREHQGQRV